MTHRAVYLGVLLAMSPAALAAQADVPEPLRPLLAPRLANRPAESMLVVTAQGDPRVVGASAFGLLFQLYYQIPQTASSRQPPAPRARWPVAFDRPRAEWVGHYALPVPEAVTAVPPHAARPGLEASLTTWEYGAVVEVLHVGPYDQEEPTLERLRAFAREQGYRLVGEHEEEYVRGPTMTGPGDPARYLTILRYRVLKDEP